MIARYLVRESIVEVESIEAANLAVCISPTEEERAYLVNQLGIDEHTLQSAMDPDEIARLEFEPGHIAMIFKRPKNYSAEDRFVFKVASVGFFWFPDRLILIAPADFQLHEGKSLAKVSSLQDLVLRIMERTITQYLGHLKTINMVADALEHRINRAMESRYHLDLFSLEKGMVHYQSAIRSNGIVIEKLRGAAARIGFSAGNVELLEDIAIENRQCYEQTEIYSTIFASLMDARVSIVSNNLNRLIKLLSIITIGLMVPTFVVSVFSMNLRIPLASHPRAFWYVLGIAGLADLLFILIWQLSSRRKP
jgi:magnesium transporter